MTVIDGERAYQGAYAERVQKYQSAQIMTEEQKAASVEKVKKAMEELGGSVRGSYDSVALSEEAKNFLKGESQDKPQNVDSDSKAVEFVEYIRFYRDDRIAGSDDPFWRNTGSQYLVFSEKLYNSGFFDHMSDEQVREAESVLSAITQGMDSLSNAWYMTGQGSADVSGKGYTLPTSYEARMELESSTAALMLFGEKYIEDEGLREEFEGLVRDYHEHNSEVLSEYANPVEQMDKAVSRFYDNPGSALNNDLFARAISQNPSGVAHSRYMGSVAHTEAEEQQYGKELAEIFGQLRQNSSGQGDIWKMLQNVMMNYATGNGGSQKIRDQVPENAGDSFRRMENSWALLL